MILTYKYRIKDRSARKALNRYALACNQVWNWCVAQQMDIESRYRAGAPRRKWPSAFELSGKCKGVGIDLGIHQQTVQNICDQFCRSRNAFRHAPKFRRSFGLNRNLGWVPFQQQSRQIKGNSITYKGKRFLFWEGKRPLPDNAKGGCFVEDAMGRWYVCFYVDIEQPKIATGEVGIDLGLKDFAVLSDGHKIEAPRIYRKMETRLAVAQRSKNKRRAKAIHVKIGNARRDFHHKLSTHLAREYAFIAVGNVNPKTRSVPRLVEESRRVA